jgi:hypothetical protein
MAQVTGPCLSLAASGTVGATVQFRRSGGRSIVCLPKALRGYDGPNAIARRALYSALARLWKVLDQTYKAGWRDLNPATDSTGWGNFLRTNLQRWTHYMQPAAILPLTALGTADAPGFISTSKSGFYFRPQYGVGVQANTWIALCHHSLTNGFTPTRSTLIDAKPVIPNQLERRIMGPFTPGTHYFKIVTPYWSGSSFRTSGQQTITFP